MTKGLDDKISELSDKRREKVQNRTNELVFEQGVLTLQEQIKNRVIREIENNDLLIYNIDMVGGHVSDKEELISTIKSERFFIKYIEFSDDCNKIEKVSVRLDLFQ